MRHYLLRHWQRYAGPAVVVGFVCISTTLSVVLSIAFFYQLTPAQVIRAIPDTPRKALRSAVMFVSDLPYAWYFFLDAHVPVYAVTVDPEKYRDLLAHVPTTDTITLPPEAQKNISGQVVFDGRTYDMKMDLRGDTNPHWLYPKKSWQVKLADGKDIDGMTELNFIVPQRRYYVAEMLNDYRAEKFGLPVPKHGFAILRINGRSSGVYYMTEGITDAFLARAGFETPTDAFAERGINEPIFTNLDFWKKVTTDSERSVDDWGPLFRLLEIVAAPDDAAFRRHFFELVDRDRFFDWYTHAWLSGSSHQDWAHNLRIVVDRQSGKLVFLPWDVGVWSIEGLTPDNHYSPMISRIIEDPELRLERDRRAFVYLSDSKNIADDLAAYDRFAAASKRAFYQDRAKAFTNRYWDREVARYRSTLEQNAIYLRAYLERADFEVEVFVPPDQTGPVVVDVLSGNPVPLDIQHVTASGGIVVFDANKNGVRDAADVLFTQPVRVMTAMRPTDPRPEQYLPMEPVEGRTRFFIEGYSGPWQSDSVQVSAENVLTGHTASQHTRWFLETAAPPLP